MANPSISWPDWMDEEIESRKADGEPKSHYVRKALQARFNAENADEWNAPELKQPDGRGQTVQVDD